MGKQATTDQGASAKKPYSKPIMRVYGTLEDMTKATNNAAVSSDNCGVFMDRRTH
jgi:hypothetical protein